MSATKRRPITAEEQANILRNADRLSETDPHYPEESVRALLPPEYVEQIAARISRTGASARLDRRHAVAAVISQLREDIAQGLVTVAVAVSK